jgi:hypothetical protein
MERQVSGLKQCITIFTILLWNCIIPPLASAHPIVQFWENRSTSGAGLVFEPRLSFYSASEHYNQNSDKTALPGGLSVNRQYLDLHAYFPMGDAWTLFGRLSILRSQIKDSPTGDASAFGLGDQLVGAAYRLVDSPGGLRWTAQLEATIPTYSNGAQKQNGQPYLGDASYDFILGSFIGLPLDLTRTWAVEFGAGYRYRTHAFSSAIPYSLLIKREPRDSGLLLSAGLRGQLSLNTDPSDETLSLPDQILGAGGSDLIYAINPAWMVAQVSGGYRTSSGTSLDALLGYPLSGKNAPAGLQLTFGARFDFGSVSEHGGTSAPAATKSGTATSTTTAAASKSTARTSKPTPTGKNRKSDESLSYTLNAEVTSANDSLYLCKIDLGASDGIQRGQIFDIFRFVTDPQTGFRKEERVARAQVTSVKNSEAAMSVIEYFVDQWVEVGFIARRLVE